MPHSALGGRRGRRRRCAEGAVTAGVGRRRSGTSSAAGLGCGRRRGRRGALLVAGLARLLGRGRGRRGAAHGCSVGSSGLGFLSVATLASPCTAMPASRGDGLATRARRAWSAARRPADGRARQRTWMTCSGDAAMLYKGVSQGSRRGVWTPRAREREPCLTPDRLLLPRRRTARTAAATPHPRRCPTVAVPPEGPPDNKLVWSILVTLFCCLPFGVVAIIKSAEVNSKWNAGDVAGAQPVRGRGRQVDQVVGDHRDHRRRHPPCSSGVLLVVVLAASSSSTNGM